MTNWFEGGLEISADKWIAAKAFHDSVQEASGWVEPFVSPCGDGTIHIAWVKSDRIANTLMNIEIDGDTYYVTFRDSFLSGKAYEVSAKTAAYMLRIFLVDLPKTV